MKGRWLAISKKKFAQTNFLPHICRAMKQQLNIQWWWQSSAEGGL